MSRKSIAIKILLPFLILLVGVGGMRLLLQLRTPPQKQATPPVGRLVEVVEVSSREHRLTIHATGTVQPRRETELTPQVSGRAVFVAPELRPGGFFRQGETMIEIEQTDYILAADRAEAVLAKARLDLAMVESQARVARREWDRLGQGDPSEANPLALWEPQLENARAAVKSAEAGLEQAKLDSGRTRIVAPFPCRVRSEQVDSGQYLRAGTPVASVTGTESAEVIVPLPMEDLVRVRVPGPSTPGPGAPATVCLPGLDESFCRQGRIDRSLGEVDARGRMTRIAVLVTDPYDLAGSGPAGRPPLDIGLFAEVALEGETLPSVIPIPAALLREGNTVHVAGPDNRLQIRPVTLSHRERDTVWVSSGLSDGDRVVVSRIEGAVEGMKLRTPDSGETP